MVENSDGEEEKQKLASSIKVGLPTDKQEESENILWSPGKSGHYVQLWGDLNSKVQLLHGLYPALWHHRVTKIQEGGRVAGGASCATVVWVWMHDHAQIQGYVVYNQ